MYNKKTHCWQSDEYDESIVRWANAVENKENADAMFILADKLLVTAERGAGNIEAVYLMESAAKQDNPRAALAMAQMFQYGWGVHQNKKSAFEWYKKAAELGAPEAIKYINDLKKRKKKNIIISVISAVLVIAAVVASIIIIPKFFKKEGIKLNENAEYIEHTDIVELMLDINELKDAYDNEDIRSGKKKASRIFMQFEGEYLDLSDFDIVKLIKNSDGMIIIQFKTFEETERCYKYLKELEGVIAISIDQYNTLPKTIATPDDINSTQTPYTSPYTNFSYLSWGVEYMGLDILSAWAMKQSTKPVVVAVIDSGSTPCEENQSRYVEGFDFVDPTKGDFYDGDGHGTHVAGTILDTTRGLDVSVMPLRVLDDFGGGTDLTISLAINYARKVKVDVMNLSLGGQCNPTDPFDSCGGYIPYAIRQAVAEGIVIVVAAGNEMSDTVSVCPAHVGEAITVSGCCLDDTLYGTYNSEIEGGTNYGEAVDVCAPAYHVCSYYLNSSFAELTGTSMAAPHISGLVAILKAAEPTAHYTPTQIDMLLKNYTVYMDAPLYYGAGIPWAPHFAGS